MRATGFVAAALALAAMGRAPAQEEVGKRDRPKIKIEWSAYDQSKSYAIEYEKVIPSDTVKKVAEALESILEQYVVVFREKPREKFKVRFLDSQNTYEQEGGLPTTAGHYSPPTKTLVLKQLPFYNLVPTAYHEAFHQYLDFYVGGGVEIPTWFNEGMAMYYEAIQTNPATKKLDFRQIDNRRLRIVRDKVLTRTAIPLEKLFGAKYEEFHDKEKSGEEGLHYDQSFSVIYFLMQGMGGKPVAQFADTLKKSKDVDAAYERLLGKGRKNLKSLEGKWKSYVASAKIEDKPVGVR